MIKRIFAIITVFALLLPVAACSRTDDSSSAKDNENEQQAGEAKPERAAGFASDEALVSEFIACYNSGSISDEFWAAYDEVGFVAYWMSDDGGKITVDEAYEVYKNRDKGMAFIADYYPSFVDHWEEYYGIELTDKAFAEYIEGYEEKEGYTRSIADDVFAKCQESFGGTDAGFDPDELWHSEYGYSTYDVSVHDPDGLIREIGLIFIYRDGGFYWVLLKQTE